MLYTDAVNSKDHHQKQSLLLHQPASQPAACQRAKKLPLDVAGRQRASTPDVIERDLIRFTRIKNATTKKRAASTQQHRVASQPCAE